MSDKQQHQPHRKTKEKKQRPAGSENPKAFALANPGRFRKQAARAHDVKEKRLHVPLVDRLPDEAPPLVVGVVGPPGVGKTTLIKSLIRRYTKQTVSMPRGPLTVVTGKRRRLTFMECPADSLASMIDIAKIVDIVLLMIDGNYGFEMETMEFLNVLSSSGMPGNVFGILTHLDMFKKQDTLRTRKKQLKHRFWSELYQGAKLFYLSGVVNGRYPDREVLNLSRFLSVMKNPRPLVWRNSHPYCLADRFLDLTPPAEVEENPKCDRTIALYGYLRGTNFPDQGAKVHIPGVGDLDVASIEALRDPCPTPFMENALAKSTGKVRKKLGEKQKILFAPMSDVGGVMVDKDAVYIDVKQQTFNGEDGDIQDKGFGEQMVIGLQGDRRLLGQSDNRVRLFANNASIDPNTIEAPDGERRRRPAAFAGDAAGEEDLSDEDEAYVSGSGAEDQEDGDDGDDGVLRDPKRAAGHGRYPKKFGFEEDDEDENVRGDIAFADSDSDAGSLSLPEEDEEELDGDADSDADGDLSWKANLAEKARAMHSDRRPRQTRDLVRLMYDLAVTPRDAIRRWNGDAVADHEPAEEDADDDTFFKARQSKSKPQDDEDRAMPRHDANELAEKWANDANVELLHSRFTSHPKSNGERDGDGRDEEGQEGFDDESGFGDESDEGDGEFEDLEAPGESKATQEAAKAQSLEDEREKNARKKEELRLRFEEEDRDGFANDKANARRETGVDGGDYGEDEWYDAQKAKIQKQLDINRAEFDELDGAARARIEGHKAGTYARLVFSRVPCEFTAHFDARSPLIVGGLAPTETRYGFVQTRIKRHRWHARILKNNDPLIVSLGWRRFQTLPVYSISDSRTRNRMLKYTPEHMHCFGTFYGPLVAPNTGFCAVQSLAAGARGFRVAATGVVLDVDAGAEIVKKLKLKGVPHRVFKNTAILRDLFGSELEAAKFKAAQLRTVSGVRGMVKGPAGRQFPAGYVRAGFEDKILKSDIVYLSTWRAVHPRRFCMPITNLLAAAPSSSAATDPADGHLPPPTDLDLGTSGMRLTGTLRAAAGIPTPSNRDSQYRPVARAERHFNPLHVPRRLAHELPFRSQIARMPAQASETYMSKRAVVAGGGEARRARDLMSKMLTLRRDQAARRAAAQEKRREPHRRRVAEDAEKRAARERRERDAYWRREGRKRKGQEEQGGGAAKRRR